MRDSKETMKKLTLRILEYESAGIARYKSETWDLNFYCIEYQPLFFAIVGLVIYILR